MTRQGVEVLTFAVGEVKMGYTTVLSMDVVSVFLSFAVRLAVPERVQGSEQNLLFFFVRQILSSPFPALCHLP